MSLCHVCLNLDLAAISRSGANRHFGCSTGFPGDSNLFFMTRHDKAVDINELLTPFHDSIESLNKSATICDLCKLVQEIIDPTIQNMRRARELGFHYETSQFSLWVTDIGETDGFKVVAKESRDDNPENFAFWLMGAFGFCVTKESPLASRIRTRQIPESPRVPSVVEKIQTWMEECEEEHGHPRLPVPPLPTRVLRITDHEEKVFLHISYKMPGEYVSLSHCWGSTRPMTLTRDNLETLQKGINICELPQTFQDAIWLTRQLGISYLWIDSLCILQDDLDDWTTEAANMSEVYRNATLGIAATRAAASSEGFLGDREKLKSFSFPLHTDGISHEVLTYNLLSHFGHWVITRD